jgi:hypothetical protein
LRKTIALASTSALLCLSGVALADDSGSAGGAEDTCPPPAGWHVVGTDTFKTNALTKSQGATSDGAGWIFSWQGGLERTDDSFTTQAVGTWPPELAFDPQFNPDGTNHVGNNHIGDVDVYGGFLYAPFEDGGQDAGVTQLNNPEYQHPYIAVYNAKTLQYTGVSYALPLELHAAGVPWVAVNADAQEVYTAEWDMPHDRINVFDLQMHFHRFIDLVYPPELGAGFHLSRIQGAKVLGHYLYATRDDDGKSLFRVDLHTGGVTKLLSLNPGVPAELEGLAMRPTADGALLHLLIVLHNKVDSSGDAANIQVQFVHLAPEAGTDSCRS